MRNPAVRLVWILLSLAQTTSGNATAMPPGSPGQAGSEQEIDRDTAADRRWVVRIVDGNRGAMAEAVVSVRSQVGPGVVTGSSDYLGYCRFLPLSGELFQLTVTKPGFYLYKSGGLTPGQLRDLEVTMSRFHEYSERVDVVSSPVGIDPARTESEARLDVEEIVNLPYPASRDFRNALPLIPGVLQDATGQIHISGSATPQILNRLDGMNVTHPVDGFLTVRVSSDALRSIEVLSSRYSAEYGKGSGGVVQLGTGMGDDQYRFSATNFIPSFQAREGINLGNWTPRATISGPLARGKAWFFNATDGEYDLNIIPELPPGSNRSRARRLNNLAKLQLNLTPNHRLTAGFLINRFSADHHGLSRFHPLETTTDQTFNATLVSLQDQVLLSGKTLIELGLGAADFISSEEPLGNSQFIISPTGTSGNFYRSSNNRARRLQGSATVTLSPGRWLGRHEFRLGGSIDRISHQKEVSRRPIVILRDDGSIAREVRFSGDASVGETNLELGGFVQDRWSFSERFLLEAGSRFDWDRIIRDLLISPRIALSYLPGHDRRTRIAAGIGVFYDAIPLGLVTAPLEGTRLDRFYGVGQDQPAGEIATRVFVDRAGLRVPRLASWSVELQRRLQESTFLSFEVLQKRGRDGFTLVRQEMADSRDTVLRLSNQKRDRYISGRITLRRTVPGHSDLFASYTRSKARSNAVVDFDLDNPVFGPQSGGPPAWDSPHQLVVWGWYPVNLFGGLNLAYALQWRSGFPFSFVNEDQELVGLPHRTRFPANLTLNLHLEKRFRLLGGQWALRAGFNNLTGHSNPTAVDNNIDSPNFLTYGGVQGRAFTGRIRFLGRQ